MYLYLRILIEKVLTGMEMCYTEKGNRVLQYDGRTHYGREKGEFGENQRLY